MTFVGKKRLLQFSVLILVVAAAIGLLHRQYAPVAYGQCLTACLAQHQCDLDFSHPHKIGNDCLIAQNQCSAQCGGGEAAAQPVAHNLAAPSSSVPAGPFGAIAYDKDSGAWGLSDFSPNQDSADRSALGFCGQYGPRCAVVATFSATCAAVATGGRTSWAGPKTRTAIRRRRVRS